MTQRMRLVPEDLTAEMIRAIETQNLAGYAADAWNNAISASPNGGSVTDADLERAAFSLFMSEGRFSGEWFEMRDDAKNHYRRGAKAVLTAIGLALASQPTQTGER